MRYLTIPDIRDTRTWRNPNAARLYLYMAMAADKADGGYRCSRRKTCQEIGITEDAYRHALKIIEADGLVRLQPPKKHPREHPNEPPSPPPHITVVRVSELYDSNPPSSTPASTPASTPNNPPISNKNINKKYNLTHARMRAVGLIPAVAEYIHTSEAEARVAVKAFLDTMAHKSKTWEDEEDMTGHLMDWCLKRWTGVESRKAAEDKATARAEREEQNRQREAPQKTEEQETEEVRQWLTGALRRENIRTLLDAKLKNGWLLDDSMRARAEKVLDATPGLRQQLDEALGYDVLRQQVLNL